MNKITAKAKKYWWVVAIATFILGVGSISGASMRAKEVVTDPANAVSK